jgi:uncharacterized membrane protein YecN with MAPEG domain
MSAFAITSLYAALSGLLILVLAWRVVEVRGSAKVGLGDGGNETLQRRIRVHANAVETIPIALILLALAEAGGTPAWGLHLAGAALVVSRVLHAQGLSSSPHRSFGRFWGTLVSWLVILGLSVWLLVRGVLG